MGLKHEIKKGIDNTADALDEAAHRDAAESERMRRELTGEDMTLGEKAKSVVNEARHDVEAEIDRGKRTIRNKT